MSEQINKPMTPDMFGICLNAFRMLTQNLVKKLKILTLVKMCVQFKTCCLLMPAAWKVQGVPKTTEQDHTECIRKK